MSLYNIIGSSSMQGGQPEDISQVVANLQAIQTILNGGIDDANVRATAAIQLSKLNGYPVGGDGTKFAGGDGTWRTMDWLPLPTALTYSTTDGHTFVVTTGADMTGIIPLGARIKLTHSAAVKYFIVTAIAAGSITLYGGQNYTLAAGAITLPFFSQIKAPFGFPLDPIIWTEVFTSSVGIAVTGIPGNGLWFNLSSIHLDIPIGLWEVEWKGIASVITNATSPQGAGTLSTTTSTETDKEFTETFWNNASAISQNFFTPLGRRKRLNLAVKTTYSLLIETLTTVQSGGLAWQGAFGATFIRAKSEYV